MKTKPAHLGHPLPKTGPVDAVRKLNAVTATKPLEHEFELATQSAPFTQLPSPWSKPPHFSLNTHTYGDLRDLPMGELHSTINQALNARGINATARAVVVERSYDLARFRVDFDRVPHDGQTYRLNGHTERMGGMTDSAVMDSLMSSTANGQNFAALPHWPSVDLSTLSPADRVREVSKGWMSGTSTESQTAVADLAHTVIQRGRTAQDMKDVDRLFGSGLLSLNEQIALMTQLGEAFGVYKGVTTSVDAVIDAQRKTWKPVDEIFEASDWDYRRFAGDRVRLGQGAPQLDDVYKMICHYELFVHDEIAKASDAIRQREKYSPSTDVKSFPEIRALQQKLDDLVRPAILRDYASIKQSAESEVRVLAKDGRIGADKIGQLPRELQRPLLSALRAEATKTPSAVANGRYVVELPSTYESHYNTPQSNGPKTEQYIQNLTVAVELPEGDGVATVATAFRGQQLPQPRPMSLKADGSWEFVEGRVDKPGGQTVITFSPQALSYTRRVEDQDIKSIGDASSRPIKFNYFIHRVDHAFATVPELNVARLKREWFDRRGSQWNGEFVKHVD